MSNQPNRELVQRLENCASACARCAVENLRQSSTGLIGRSARLAMDCASVCRDMAAELSLEDKYAFHLIPVCVFVCTSFGEECERLTGIGLEYSSECRDLCYQCAEACRGTLTAA
jgi:hypothetical protein